MSSKFPHPLVSCLLLGLALALFLNSQQPPPSIVVTTEQVDQLEAQIAQQFGDTGEIDRNQLVEQIAEEEILYLEAKSLGLDQTQAVVTRLANVAVFLQLVGEDSTLEQRYRAALDMKLDETDIVVRRQMVTLLKTQLRNSIDVPEPDETQINGYYQDNPGKFSRPERYAFVHIYAQSREALLEATRNVLPEQFTPYQDSSENLKEVVALGEVFYGGHKFKLQSEQQIARHFGHSFASTMPTLSVEQWSEPVESAFGWHRVWLDAKVPEQLRPLDDVREQIIRDIKLAEQQVLYTQALEQLRSRYVVELTTPQS